MPTTALRDPFTIVCHGSGRHRGRKSWCLPMVIHACLDRTGGGDYHDYLVLDGVGGEPEKVPQSVWQAQNREGTPGVDVDQVGLLYEDKHKMAGDYDVATIPGGTLKQATMVNGRSVSVTLPFQVRLKVGNPTINRPGRLATEANATGFGMSQNAEHAYRVVKSAAILPQTVNIMGWSRGAVTCIKIANLLNQDPATKGIDVNIFAVDPVAGPTHTEEHKTSHVPPNVKNIVLTLCNHDRRSFFTPQDQKRLKIEDPSKTNFIWLPFPGVHNTQPMPPEDFPFPGMIVYQLAYDFLKHHGTMFAQLPFNLGYADGYPLSALQVVKMYNQMLMNEELYRLYGQQEFDTWVGASLAKGGGKEKWRGFWKKHLAEYVTWPGMFINEHHRYYFAKLFPNTYADLGFGGVNTLDVQWGTNWTNLALDNLTLGNAKKTLPTNLFFDKCWRDNYRKKVDLKDKTKLVSRTDNPQQPSLGTLLFGRKRA